MSNATELTASNFEDTVGSGVALVDFWAEWCGPCRLIAPTIDALASEYEGKAVIGKVNVDNEMDIAQKFDVQSIPTLIVFKDGQEVNRFVGAGASKDDLAQAIDSAAG